jgi:hypothetical protein
LVIDQIRGQSGDGEVSLSLSDQFVTGRERDQVRESLHRDGVAVGDQVGDSFSEAGELCQEAISPGDSDAPVALEIPTLGALVYGRGE